MMRILKIIASCLFIMLMRQPLAYAMPEAEYDQMLSDFPAFRQADEKLGKAWKLAKAALTEDGQKKLLAEQRKWIKNGRDEHAARLINEQGLSKIEAYTQAVDDRTAYLEALAQNHPAQMSSQRPDEIAKIHTPQLRSETDKNNERVTINHDIQSNINNFNKEKYFSGNYDQFRTELAAHLGLIMITQPDLLQVNDYVMRDIDTSDNIKQFMITSAREVNLDSLKHVAIVNVSGECQFPNDLECFLHTTIA